MLITNSWNPLALRRMVPVHCAEAGNVVGHPGPLTTVPAQLPNTESPGAWFTATVCPATVSVALRASPTFSATVMPTVPGPLLLLAEVTLTNELLEATVQAQPLFVVTPIVAVPPTPAMLNVVAPNVYEQVVEVGDVGVDGEDDELAHAAIASGIATISNGRSRGTMTSERSRVTRG